MKTKTIHITMKSIRTSLFLALIALSTSISFAQTAKPAAAKPKATTTPLPVVGGLADVFSGASATEFAGNVKVLQGVMKVGEKYELFTVENKKIECTIKEMKIAATYLVVKEAPKDNELFIVFTTSEGGVECTNGAIAFPGSIKSYDDFLKIQKEYKAPVKSDKKEAENPNLYMLKNK